MLDKIDLPDHLYPAAYHRRIKAGKKAGVVLVFVYGDTEEELDVKAKLVIKLVRAIKDFTDSITLIVKK